MRGNSRYFRSEMSTCFIYIVGFECQKDADDIAQNCQILSFPRGVGSLPPVSVQRQTRCSGSIAPQSGSAKTIPFQLCSERNKIYIAQSKSKYDTDFILLNIVMHCLVNMHKLWKRFFVIVHDAAPGNWYSSLLSCLEIKMVPLGREIRLKSFNPNVQK